MSVKERTGEAGLDAIVDGRLIVLVCSPERRIDAHFSVFFKGVFHCDRDGAVYRTGTSPAVTDVHGGAAEKADFCTLFERERAVVFEQNGSFRLKFFRESLLVCVQFVQRRIVALVADGIRLFSFADLLRDRVGDPEPAVDGGDVFGRDRHCDARERQKKSKHDGQNAPELLFSKVCDLHKFLLFVGASPELSPS